MLKSLIGHTASKALLPVSQVAYRLRITPNQITVVGMLLTLIVGVFIWQGHWLSAGLVLLLSGLLDLLDGSLARNFRMETRFGAFLDSTCDRISDAAIHLGLAFYYAQNETGLLWPFLCCIAFLGAFMTSYARARAECLILRCDVGLAERPERIVLILAGLLFGVMKPAIVILIVVSTLTVLQRIGHTFRQLRNGK